MANFVKGDLVALTAKHLKNTGQFTGNAGARRGTFIDFDSDIPNYGRVHWNDTEHKMANKVGDFAEKDYCENIVKYGSPVPLSILCKVGSPKFACNDL